LGHFPSNDSTLGTKATLLAENEVRSRPDERCHFSIGKALVEFNADAEANVIERSDPADGAARLQRNRHAGGSNADFDLATALEFLIDDEAYAAFGHVEEQDGDISTETEVYLSDFDSDVTARWPTRRGSTIDYRRGSFGGIHQPLVPIAATIRTHSDFPQAYAKNAVDAIPAPAQEIGVLIST
jgi:hypothetical protein